MSLQTAALAAPFSGAAETPTLSWPSSSPMIRSREDFGTTLTGSSTSPSWMVSSMVTGAFYDVGNLKTKGRDSHPACQKTL